ncbi:uncharacterized protein [Nicotiana tomentosiformis]|uniref:uncharacterized protein n=1 Tax=Nicotiana tomentosiformis TaxID=4098 RepID=UPI00388C4C53
MQDNGLYVTAVYVKCTTVERKDLWSSIEDINLLVDGPWCIGGDFNVIMDPKEKLGDKPHRAYKSFDFITTMEAYGFSDIGFTGPKFTWCNNRRPRKRIWKRLDMIHVNDQWSQEFLEVVQKAWNVQVTGNAMWRLKSKLQELGKNLSQWSTDKVGDIHQQLNSKYSREDLNKAHTKYINWLGLQENLLKHKTQTKWFQEGDYNTKCFRCVLRERRKRLQLHRIKNNRGRWVKGDDKITRTAIRHFSKLFNLSQHEINHNVLSCIPKCLTEDENAMLSELPDELEFMNVVFSLSADSTAEPYGYNGIFFQHYWEIIKKDVVDFVLEFF